VRGDPRTIAAPTNHAATLRTSATGAAQRVELLEELNLAGVIHVVVGDTGDEPKPGHPATRQPPAQRARGRGRDGRAEIAVHGVEQAESGAPGGVGGVGRTLEEVGALKRKRAAL